MQSKVKSNPSQQEQPDEPYFHPYLEEQMIIRFPVDIAHKIHLHLDDKKFEDFQIEFYDPHHATVRIFDETYSATLVDLPTQIETHRTVDGSYLYKSADIGEMLIVHPQNSTPTGITDYKYSHGLTPPTKNIVEKRKAKQDLAKNNDNDDGLSLDGIDYWEIVEIQLAKLLSKENQAKTVYRNEFLEEPEVDPEHLEKILRKHKGKSFIGYSGKDIPESEIETGGEVSIPIPKEIRDDVLGIVEEEEVLEILPIEKEEEPVISLKKKRIKDEKVTILMMRKKMTKRKMKLKKKFRIWRTLLKCSTHKSLNIKGNFQMNKILSYKKEFENILTG